jgi:hypothetical protein
LKWLSTKKQEDKKYIINQETQKKIMEGKMPGNKYLYRGRKFTEAWKFIRKVRTAEKQDIHIKIISNDEWLEYYKPLLTENRLQYKHKEQSPVTIQREKVKISIEMTKEQY